VIKWVSLTIFMNFFDLASPDITERFSHTDRDYQVVMLRASLEIMISDDDHSDSQGHLKVLADIHGRSGAAIPAGLYSLWHKALMEAVKKFDRAFNRHVEEAWHNIIKAKIAFMSSYCWLASLSSPTL
jgi:hypothetical protein